MQVILLFSQSYLSVAELQALERLDDRIGELLLRVNMVCWQFFDVDNSDLMSLPTPVDIIVSIAQIRLGILRKWSGISNGTLKCSAMRANAGNLHDQPEEQQLLKCVRSQHTCPMPGIMVPETATLTRLCLQMER